jgi:hypothetical protein
MGVCQCASRMWQRRWCTAELPSRLLHMQDPTADGRVGGVAEVSIGQAGPSWVNHVAVTVTDCHTDASSAFGCRASQLSEAKQANTDHFTA